ncbi:MAG TPA: hypothetical protein VMB20_10820 [Candidatus Acidoferrum sp.]|nr:hypothetical protein [Candidatus Acidoferrum sp.]
MLTLRNLFVASVLATSAVAFAACGGGGNTITNPTPGPTCAPGTTVQMIYPIPGATGVPDAPQQIVFAVGTALPNIWNAYLSNASSGNGTVNGYTAGVQTITAAQVPSPSATPSFANPVYQSVTLSGSLAPPTGTTWYVWINDTAGNCTPLGPLGSFTIQ